jgi:quercetin dioxygenase-like cupin family protein
MPVNVQHIGDHIHDAPFLKGFSATEIFGNEDKGKPVTCGRFSVNGQDPVGAKTPADGFIIVLEGEIEVENVDKGDTVRLNVGDIAHVTPGVNVKIASPTTAHGVFVTLKPLGDLSYRADVY